MQVNIKHSEMQQQNSDHANDTCDGEQHQRLCTQAVGFFGLYPPVWPIIRCLSLTRSYEQSWRATLRLQTPRMTKKQQQKEKHERASDWKRCPVERRLHRCSYSLIITSVAVGDKSPFFFLTNNG